MLAFAAWGTVLHAASCSEDSNLPPPLGASWRIDHSVRIDLHCALVWNALITEHKQCYGLPSNASATVLRRAVLWRAPLQPPLVENDPVGAFGQYHRDFPGGRCICAGSAMFVLALLTMRRGPLPVWRNVCPNESCFWMLFHMMTAHQDSFVRDSGVWTQIVRHFAIEESQWERATGQL